MIKRWILLLVACMALAASVQAGPLRFEASGLSTAGSSAVLALDFIDGDATPSNQLRARNFSSDGTPVLQASLGSVSGSLAAGLLFDDSSFFSEALISLGGANQLAFLFGATGVAPVGGGFADAFSVFLLDSLTGLSLLETDDPTGANALFQWVVDGSDGGFLQVYRQVSALDLNWNVQPVDDGGTVPEPASLLLVVLALGLLLASRLRPQLAAVAGMAALLLIGPAQAEDLTSSVQISRSGFVLNRSTNTFDSQVTVTNKSGDTLLGPLKLVLDSASPAHVALYNSHGRQPSGADYMLLPLHNGTLAPGASAVGIVRLLSYGQAISASSFSLQGQRLNAANTAQIQLSVVYPAGLMGPQETPVGAGFSVSVDGIVRGSTDAAGRLLVKVPVGAQVVAATKAPSEGGSQVLPPLVAGAMLAVKVAVDEGKEISAGSRLRFDQVQQGLLTRSSTRISLRFLKDEQMQRLTSLSNVSLIDLLGNYSNISTLFGLQSDGSIGAAPAAFFQALAGKTGQLRLEVSGEDAAGAVHVDTVAFHLSDYRVRVQLLAPPSNPALPVAGVRLVATVLNTDLRFNAQADANGYVLLPDLPAGNLSLSGSTTMAGTVYNGMGTAAINRNSLVSLTLRGPQDVLNNVPPIGVQPLAPGAAMAAGSGGVAAAGTTAPATVDSIEAQARLRLHAQHQARGPKTKALALADPNSVTVSATGGARDALAQNTAQLLVKKGIKKVTLRYTVFTAEYPTYVLQQSIYNDVWSISVLGGNGAGLFDITRQINSQLSQEPVWQANGSTGEIKREIDVSALTTDADATLIVRATSVNIGDGLLATTATATLDASEPLLIGDITPSAMPADTANDGSFYSIPRPGASNTLTRQFTLALTKPSGSTLTQVKVELRSGAGAALMTVLPETAPGTADVEILEETDTTARLKVRATIGNPASTVAGVPPPTRDIAYRFTVKATDSNGNSLSDEKDASGKRALWRMPDGRTRYGGRDAGGDDWAARGTYSWLETNGALVREINDISGEHGRNIGHASHGRGTDIDMFHFYRFPGAVSGGQNYSALAADLVLAFQTLQAPPPPAATAAFGRVAAWLAQTRAGLTSLAALGSVSRLIYCSGTATNGLPAGWCANLIQTGNATRAVAGQPNQTLAFGGSFNNAKLVYRNDHNDHVHITLNAGAIGE